MCKKDLDFCERLVHIMDGYDLRRSLKLMKIGPDLPGREPDILFVAREHLDRFEDTYLNGPADLVVEIISPDSRARDRGGKFYEYEEGGVREYWLIDPTRKQAEFTLWERMGSIVLCLSAITGYFGASYWTDCG